MTRLELIVTAVLRRLVLTHQRHHSAVSYRAFAPWGVS